MIRLARMAGAARRLVADNSPAILTAVGIAGVATTTFLAVKATPRAWMDIQDAQSERIDPLTKVEVARLTYKYYIPAAASGVVTIAAIIGVNSISSGRNKALLAAYGLSDAAFREYRDKVVETIGANKEQKVMDDVNQDIVNREMPNKQIIIASGGDVMFLDKMSGRVFESDVETVNRAVNEVNYVIINDMYASLNDFYSKLGLPSNKMGDEFGWSSDRLFELEPFTATVYEGKPVLVIDYRVQPNRGYHKFRG